MVIDPVSGSVPVIDDQASYELAIDVLSRFNVSAVQMTDESDFGSLLGWLIAGGSTGLVATAQVTTDDDLSGGLLAVVVFHDETRWDDKKLLLINRLNSGLQDGKITLSDAVDGESIVLEVWQSGPALVALIPDAVLSDQ